MGTRRGERTVALALVALLTACSPGASSRDLITPATAPALRQIAALPLPSSLVNAIAFSPDSRTLLSGDRSGEVIEWERGTWNRRPCQDATGSYEADEADGIHFYGTMALSPDGTVLVTADRDGTVRGRDRSGHELFAFPYGARVYSTAISPDGRYLAVGGVASNILVYDLPARALVADLPSDREYISFLVFTPDGRTLLAGYERPGNLISAWSMASRQELWTSPAADRFDYHDAVVTPDGRSVVFGAHGRSRNPNFIDVVDLETRAVVGQYGGYGGAPYQLALSPDGALLAAGINESAVWIWDRQTGDPVKVIPTPGGSVMSVAFSPDGTLLAFGVEREGIQVWAVGE